MQFAIHSAFDILGFAKAVLIARKWHAGDRQPLSSQGRHHQLGLIRRYDPVFQALEDNQRIRELLCKMNR